MRQEFCLVIRGAGPALRRYPLAEGRHVIGRAEECDIRVEQENVSRVHAEIWRNRRGISLCDLGSTNGTFVNGRRVTNASLAVGDEVQLGRVHMQLLNKADAIRCVTKEETTARGNEREKPSIPRETHTDGLSVAALRVLHLVLQGHSEKQVAQMLDLSPHTVHNHVKHIHHVFGVHSKGELLSHCLAPALVTEFLQWSSAIRPNPSVGNGPPRERREERKR